MQGFKLAGLAACAALLWSDVAVAQTVNLEGCPASKGEARTLLSSLKVVGARPGGTKSYATDTIRLRGDKVAGIFAEDYNASWLHIQLSRPPATYVPAFKARYANDAERMNCDQPDGCYIRMKDGRYNGLHSVDITKFTGRFEKEGEPDGYYLICFY
ncbi:hypothetical protein [Sphingomonas soli]|uniref:hypothetical protein n=1 Tax=Sphingomonas soli TaxID=266127 RepID=UPI00082C1CFF|nr:hypothetical protein [Sphingomonas soli]